MSENPDPIQGMNESELRAEIIMMRKSMANFVSNYNDNIDVLLKMEETIMQLEESILDLDAENERQQTVEKALLTTIAVLSVGVLE